MEKTSILKTLHRRIRGGKNQNFTTAKQLFLLSIMYQLTGFNQIMALEMIQHIFRSYRIIEETDLKKRAVKMMKPYDPKESLACLIDQL